MLSFPDSGTVLGPADGAESYPATGWISASCSVPEQEASIEQMVDNLKTVYPTLLSSCPQLRLTFTSIKDYFHWMLAQDEYSV